MRDVFFLPNEKYYGDASTYITQNLYSFLQADKSVVTLFIDSIKPGSIVEQCIKDFPDRAFDVGIAEQNFIGMAAGLAIEGKKVFCNTFGPFVCLRALDQLHTDVAYNDAPVCIVITNAGLIGKDGPTHNSIMDIGTLRMIPGMTVCSPCDAFETLDILDAYLKSPRPLFVRCGEGKTPLIFKERNPEFTFSRAEVLHTGDDATLISTGMTVYEALYAAQALALENIHITVIDMHTIKPLDEKIILYTAQKTKNIITVEDHNILGGLGGAVAEVLLENNVQCKFKRLGIRDTFADNGKREELYRLNNIDAKGIISSVKEVMRHE